MLIKCSFFGSHQAGVLLRACRIVSVDLGGQVQAVSFEAGVHCVCDSYSVLGLLFCGLPRFAFVWACLRVCVNPLSLSHMLCPFCHAHLLPSTCFRPLRVGRFRAVKSRVRKVFVGVARIHSLFAFFGIGFLLLPLLLPPLLLLLA